MMKTAIIGGGAAGLMAACLLSRAKVPCTVLEKQPRVGRKLLSTGNGRCNLTNLHASPEFYHGDARFVREALGAFPPESAMDFFESIGVPCVPDEEGRVYPLSNQAAGVLDALRLYAQENGAEFITECPVSGIRKAKSGFILEANERMAFDHVLIACGGLAAPKLGGCADGYRLLENLGHTVTPKLPAIAPLKTDPDAVRALKGIRAHAELSLISDGKTVRSEEGEILFNETGVSGICAMQLARDVNLLMQRGRKCALSINFVPDIDIQNRARLLPKRSMEDFLSGVMPKRLGQVILKSAGISPLSINAEELSPAQCAAIERAVTGWTLNIRGTLSFDQAQVTCGGAALGEFDLHTLESKKAPGLFAVGEVLDVDGDCGGFNLQWAWASAFLAANEIIRRNGL